MIITGGGIECSNGRVGVAGLWQQNVNIIGLNGSMRLPAFDVVLRPLISQTQNTASHRGNNELGAQRRQNGIINHHFRLS